MYPLHFGHFAGILSKAVWGALGVAMCFVILSGFRLWVRRRAEAPLWRGFGRAVQVTGYGLPIGMLAVGLRLLPVAPGRRPVLVDARELRARRRARGGDRPGGCPTTTASAWLYQRLLGAACLALPVLRIATGGMDWAEAVLARQTDVLTVDLLLLRRRRELLVRSARAAAAARPCWSRPSERARDARRHGGQPRGARLPRRDRPEAPPRVPAAGGRAAARRRSPGPPSLLPGVLVPAWSGGGGFLIWFGATTVAGWGLAATSPPRAAAWRARAEAAARGPPGPGGAARRRARACRPKRCRHRVGAVAGGGPPRRAGAPGGGARGGGGGAAAGPPRRSERKRRRRARPAGRPALSGSLRAGCGLAVAESIAIVRKGVRGARMRIGAVA